MVYREAFVMTYAWHLTTFFERARPTGHPEWAFWSYDDIAQPSGMAAASEAVREMEWVVFCQATSEALPSHVQRWAEGWPSPESEAQAFVGFFCVACDGSDSEGKAQECLRKLAYKTSRGFVTIRDGVWADRSSVPRGIAHLQPTRLIYE